QERGELFVANDGGDSVLVFRASDQGDVAPIRVIKGAKTELQNPTGVWVDTKNGEVIASSMGNQSAVVFPLLADGNVPPVRLIPSARAGTKALAIGNPGAVGYDSKREELLVPNCVAHPQIAVFARQAKNSDLPHRAIAGQATLLARTIHDIRYDDLHDE